jgi:hypothetical protein
MNKIIVFLVEFLMGLAVRSAQFALFAAAAALPVPLLIRLEACQGYWDEWFFVARQVFAAGVVLYLVVRMARLLFVSWRNEL